MSHNEYSNLRRSINSYIDKYPTPTKIENEKLLRELQEKKKAGDKSYLKIRDKLVLSNGGFAMKYVMRYKSVLTDDVSVADLFQEATLGLIETIDIFDLDLDTSFTTYAFYHIRKRLVDFIKKNKLVRAPRDIARNMKHVHDIKDRLFTECGKEPNTEEIRRELKKRKKITLSKKMIDKIVILLDLNSADNDDSFISEFKEQVNVIEDYDLFKAMKVNILKEIEKLPERHQEIIKLRFGIENDYPHTIEEIKYMLNICDDDLL